MNWDKLTEHLDIYQRKVVPIAGDGKCFLTAVRTCLANDYLIAIPEEEFDSCILNEIYNNLGQYTQFHEGTNRQIIQDAEEFFKHPKLMYGKDIMDVIVCAAANAFEMNFAIYQNIGGKAVIIFTNCSKIETNRTVYLKFDYCPGYNAANHYSAIVEDTAKKPTEPNTNVIPDETEYEPVTPSPTTPTSSPEDYIDISQATTILEHDVDLTCDIVEDFIQEKMQRTKMKNKQRKRRRNHMDMSLL